MWHLNCGGNPLPARVVARRAVVDLVIRQILFLANMLMLGSMSRMTFTESWFWAIPVVAFVVHVLAVSRVRRHYWLSTRLYYIQA